MLQHTTTIIVGFKYFNNDNTNGATPYSIDTCEVGICPSFQFLSIWPKLKPLLNTQRIQRKQGVAFGRMFLRYCLPHHWKACMEKGITYNVLSITSNCWFFLGISPWLGWFYLLCERMYGQKENARFRGNGIEQLLVVALLLPVF